MAKNFWHRAANRPINPADEGRFVLGRCQGGWTAGYVAIQPTGPVIDTCDTSGNPMSRYVAANGLRVYTFLNAPPPWEEARSDVPDQSGKVVRFRE